MKLKKINLKIANSTNDVAIKKIKSGLCSGIVISQKQKKGRGRYGKKWISYNGNLFVGCNGWWDFNESQFFMKKSVKK